MNTTTKILAGVTVAGLLVVGGIEAQVPAPDKLDGFVKNEQTAKTFRKYLTERAVYLESQKDIQLIPKEVIDRAPLQVMELEDYLLKKGYTDIEGGEIKQPPKPTPVENLLNKGIMRPTLAYLSDLKLIPRAYAFLFGKEDFESCGGGIPCTFTSNDSYGTGTMTLDATSKVNSTNSLKCTIVAADDGCLLTKSITSTAETWIQLYYLIPTGWTFGVNDYASLFGTEDAIAGLDVYCNIENYGTVRITCSGATLAYTDTGIDLALNTKHRLEFRIKISATVGDLDIWLNNTTEGSPSYNGSGTMNTGVTNMAYFFLGGYHPDAVNAKYYDDAIQDSAFIGLGTVAASTPFRQYIYNLGDE